MKKTAVFSMAAFYLLLTTGMFVCIVHCAAEKLVRKTAAPMAHNGSSKKHHKKHCGEDCRCCKTHASYAIKENIKPNPGFDIFQSIVLVYHPVAPDFLLHSPVTLNDSWSDSNAPPWKSGKSISIRHRSLQI